MLSRGYAEALRALKDQASAAPTRIVGGASPSQVAALSDAQARVAKYALEAKAITRLLSRSADPQLTIYTLDEERLEKELQLGQQAETGSR